jgi:Ankyrin repeats (3 copies)
LAIQKICSSLLAISEYAPSPDNHEREIKFAHYSVKRYLESDRAPSAFRITAENANATVARISLIYILSVDLWASHLRSYPFGRYAGAYWFEHAAVADERGLFQVDDLVIRLLSEGNVHRLQNAVDIRHPTYDIDIDLASCDKIDDRLFLAAYLGFPKTCRALIGNGADINAPLGELPGAICGACLGGHFAVAKLLLDLGAKLDSQDQAIQIACSRGSNVDIVRLLLEHGCDSSRALTYAAAYGIVEHVQEDHEEVVLLLLENGAGVDGKPNYSPLPLAANEGNEGVVRRLLEYGANIDASYLEWANAVEAAVDGTQDKGKNSPFAFTKCFDCRSSERMLR